MKIQDEVSWEKKNQKLLGIIINRTLSFDDHLVTLCIKTGRKVSALGRLVKFLTLEQKSTLMKAFIESEFAY